MGACFSRERLTFQPEPENVSSGVDVPIVGLSALATNPSSHSERAHTFRAAHGDRPASRARSGSPRLVNFDERSPVPAGFIAELRFQDPPARVQHGLGHAGLDELRGTDVADGDKFVLPSDLRRPLVKLMAACVGDLGVDRLDAGLVPGAQAQRARGLVLTVVSKGRDLGSIAAGGEGFEAKVDTDAASPRGADLIRLALEDDVPAPAGILRETAGLESPLDLPRLPEMEWPLSVDDRVVGQFEF